MKVLVATEKPFAAAAVNGIREIVEGAGHELALLEKYTEKEQLLAAVADADALIVRSDKVTADVVAAANQLKIVVRAGAGYDNLDLPSCTERGIVAMNTPGQNSNAVAELALGLMIYMSRNQFNPGTGCELSGKTMGIQGFGNIGQLVAKKAQGLGMNVIVLDVNQGAWKLETERGVIMDGDKPDIIEYYELTEEMANQKDENGDLAYCYGAIMNYLFRLTKLEEIVNNKIPVHIVQKKIECLCEDGVTRKPEKENGKKFEMLAVDLVKLMGSVLPYEVVREKEFAPIKNKTGVDSVESAKELLKKNGVKL